MLQINKSLEHLVVKGNYYLKSSKTPMVVFCSFLEGLQYNTTLINLSLHIPVITATKPDTARSLTELLQVNKSLTHLDFSWNSLSDSGVLCIFEGLQHNATLVNLSLQDNDITATDPDTASSLTKMLQVNKSLTHLDLSRNSLSDSGAHCVYEGLQHNTALVNLSLHDNDIIAVTAKSLTRMLQVNKSLTHLDLSQNSISDSGARCIYEGLQQNTALVNLLLHDNDITANDPGTARSLTKMLQVNKSLTHLDLSRNSLSDSGAHCVYEGLQHNTALANLSLIDSNLTAESARSLTKMFQVNKTLTHLDLSFNDLSDSGAYCIFEGLQHNTALVNLSLRRSNITDTDPDVARSLTKMLQINKSLTHLDLSYNQFENQMILCIFQGLKHNTTLLHLNLLDTGITEADAEYIGQALKSTCSLQTLNIAQNTSLGDKGTCFILDSLMFNTTLKELWGFMNLQMETRTKFYKARRDKGLPPIDI